MANRTLRRSYNSTNGDASGTDATDGQLSDRVSQPVANLSGATLAEQVYDREFGVDGEHDESESNSDGVIGVRIIDPERIDEYIRDAASGTDSGTDSGTRKRRGPRAGYKRRTAGAKKAADSIEPFLVMIHAMMATKFAMPELALEPEEAKRLNDAYANFCAHHKIPILSEKRVSEIQLCSALFMVYGTRFTAVRNRMKNAKNRKANITPFPQASNNG